MFNMTEVCDELQLDELQLDETLCLARPPGDPMALAAALDAALASPEFLQTVPNAWMSGEPQMPAWLSQELFGPQLRAAVCGLDMCSALEVLRSLGISADGWAMEDDHHATVARSEIGRALLLATGGRGSEHSGGPALWIALVVGASQRGAVEADALHLGAHGLEAFIWREAAFRIGHTALLRRREQLTLLAESWTVGALRVDWERQLEHLDEAVGWCAQSIDDLVMRKGRREGAQPQARAVLEPAVRLALKDLADAKSPKAQASVEQEVYGGVQEKVMREPAWPLVLPQSRKRESGKLISFADWQQARLQAEQGSTSGRATPTGRHAIAGRRRVSSACGTAPRRRAVAEAARVLRAP